MGGGFEVVWELWARYRAAVVTAEALAWHCGDLGVTSAKDAARAPGLSRRDRFQAALVANLAEDRLQCLRSADTATRFEMAAQWAQRRGQMIR